MTYTIEEQIAEVKRELALRRNVYPEFVASKRITQEAADRRIQCMDAVLETLKQVVEAKQCVVQWRCFACKYDLLEIPTRPFGPCPSCGVESNLHGIFSDDREGLVRALNRC